MNEPSFVYVTYINTTPEKLWEALTNPEFTKQYWGGRRIGSDWNIGSPVMSFGADGRSDQLGTVIESRPREFLSYSWHSTPPSKVSFSLETYGEVMRLTVTHEGLDPESKGSQTTRQGWMAILSSLKSMLETGRALNYPRKE